MTRRSLPDAAKSVFRRATPQQVRQYHDAKRAVYDHNDAARSRGVRGDTPQSRALYRRMTEARTPLGPLQVERENWRVMDTRDRAARTARRSSTSRTSTRERLPGRP